MDLPTNLLAVRKIFAVQHDRVTRIGVTFEPGNDQVSRGLVVSVYHAEDPVRRIRFWRPEGVTKWFEANSRANRDDWQRAYHASGLTPESYVRPGGSPDDVQAEVDYRRIPYATQRDNELDAMGACNVTSCWMDMAFFGLKPLLKDWNQPEDNLNQWMKNNNKSRHNHEHLRQMMHAHGADTVFRTDQKLDDIREALGDGHLCVTSGTFTGSGHIVSVIATKGRDFIVHDPYGDYNATDRRGRHYRNDDGSPATNGAFRTYTQATLQRVLVDERRDRGGAWVHIIRGRR